MALPKLNVTPSYTMKIPSTGQQVDFRPYLVKEEKILLIAFESKDTRSILKAMLDVIQGCIETDIDINNLATFDVEYMFLKIRSKSVGETSTITINCKECKHPNEVSVNLEEVEIETPEVDSLIKLTDEVSIEMAYPTYNKLINSKLTEENYQAGVEDMMKMAASGIAAIFTDEERFETKDLPDEEITAFVEQMTTDQFKKIQNFYEAMPVLKEEVKFKCEKCEHDNIRELSGMADFF